MIEPLKVDLTAALGISRERMGVLADLIFNAFVDGVECNGQYCDVFKRLAKEIPDPVELIFTGYVVKANEADFFREAFYFVHQKRLGLVGYG